nr:ribonuclease H-like domain-containing protein [Tanacetum cinerariifolium]
DKSHEDPHNGYNKDIVEIFLKTLWEIKVLIVTRFWTDKQNLSVHNTPSWDRPTICYDDDDKNYAITVTPSLSTEKPDNSLMYINAPSWDRPTICYDDDDKNYAIAVTPSLSTEKPDNSLSMGDEHLHTVPATESDEFIKSSVENLVPIPSESEGILDNMCDVPFHDNSPPLDVSKDQFEDFSDSNNESTSINDDSFSIDNIEYVEASPPDSELVSSEVMEIVILKIGGIYDDILLTIKDDILCENLLNINFIIANIEALNDNPIPSFDFKTNSGSTTTRSDIYFLKYEAFYDDHAKEISSGSTTTHSDSSLYDSFIFDLSINPFPPADRSDFYEFADELAHIISPPDIPENLKTHAEAFCPPVSISSASFRESTFNASGPSSPHPDAFIPANTLLHVNQDDSQIPDLEDIAELQSIGIFNSAYDDDLDKFDSPVQSVGAQVDFKNMESSTIVSPIPTHKMEPKKVSQALDDESWVEAMQEELLQFSLQKVWRLVDMPYGNKAIGTK